MAVSTIHSLRSAVQHREALLEAIAYCAKCFSSSVDWKLQIDDILKKLGEATLSNRTYVFEHTQGGNEEIFTSIRFEWCSPGTSAQLHTEELQNIPLKLAGYERWTSVMGRGEAIFGAVDSFPTAEIPLLEQQEIKSLVVIPIFVNGAWWGFVGLDQCDYARDWSASEVEALKALGSMMGMAIERKEYDVKLQIQFNELQRANNELDFFVYSVSHDLRAPLSSLHGLINIAEKEERPEEFMHCLGMMRTSVTKLDGFIREVLDYSTNARVEMSTQKIDFQELLTELFEQILNKSDTRVAKLKVNVTGADPFFSDKRRLSIVLNNLLSNSLKFYDESKESTLIDVSIHIENSQALIRFKDNGIGIEAKFMDKLFTMFYRATDKSPGSGLGLYIAREVVKKLKGSIAVQSECGVGTVFTIQLPSAVKQ